VAEPQTNLSASNTDSLVGVTVGRFVIVQCLGRGGMGEVYLADDPKLKRRVAMKRITPALRDDPVYRDRFLKEAERASGVTSAHVAAIYDVLEEEKEIFLVMEYVEGQNLRDRMHARVSIEDFLKIAVQCAEALASAHSRSILHCDIKPENIMVCEDGQVKILDFGVAKRLPRSDHSTTLDSERAGTPAYMAPEFLLNRAFDGRADIFSLGIVFYEVLAGRHPFLAGSFAATIDGILRDQPQNLRTLNSQVPDFLERIVTRMLEKDPAARYAKASELLGDLQHPERTLAPAVTEPFIPERKAGWKKWTWAVLLAVAILSLATRPWWRKWWSGVPADKQLAVLPFSLSSSDPSARAFSDGLTETLTTKLTTLTNRYPLQVVPMSEIRNAGVMTVEDARRSFSVNLVLVGSMAESSGMVRITYVLEDAAAKRSLLGDVITSDASDPFAVEDKVVESILNALDLELRGNDRAALAKRDTKTPAAFDYYLRGRGYLQEYQKPEELDHAIEVFQRALDRDPNYSQAYAGLGEAYWRKYENTQDRQWVDRAAQSCQRAETLGENLAATHVCLGTVLNGTGQYEHAADEFRRAAQIDPTNDDAVRGSASAYEKLGKPRDAEAAYQQAITMRPQAWMGYNRLGIFYDNQGRYDEAVKQFEQVIRLAPDSYRGYSNLGATYLAMGRYAEAIPKFEQSAEIRPAGFSYSNLATAYFYQRQYAEAAQTYEQAVKLEEGGYGVWGNLAEAYYWAPGKRSQATDTYRKAILLAEEQLRVNPRDSEVLSYLGLYHAMLQEKVAAERYTDQALAVAPKDPAVSFNAAKADSQLGESKKALEHLADALAGGYSRYYAKDDPVFDGLQSNGNFRRLVEANSTSPNQ